MGRVPPEEQRHVLQPLTRTVRGQRCVGRAGALSGPPFTVQLLSRLIHCLVLSVSHPTWLRNHLPSFENGANSGEGTVVCVTHCARR